MGAWIEMTNLCMSVSWSPSLLSWERGLKFFRNHKPVLSSTVAPLVGAWIEIMQLLRGQPECAVAPLVGAWIEIQILRGVFVNRIVAPLVGAWIEIKEKLSPMLRDTVAPLVGAWIEIR